MQVWFTINWVSQLSADHSGIWHIPLVITNCAVCVVDADLHPTLSCICTIHQYHFTIETCWNKQKKSFATPSSTFCEVMTNQLLELAHLLQIVPLPTNPRLHMQLKSPSVFTHWAFSSQISVPDSHSLISEREVYRAWSTPNKSFWQRSQFSLYLRDCLQHLYSISFFCTDTLQSFSYWPVQSNPDPSTSW